MVNLSLNPISLPFVMYSQAPNKIMFIEPITLFLIGNVTFLFAFFHISVIVDCQK